MCGTQQVKQVWSSFNFRDGHPRLLGEAAEFQETRYALSLTRSFEAQCAQISTIHPRTLVSVLAVTGREIQLLLLLLGEISDEDALQQKQRPLVACGDDGFRNEAEAPTTGHVTSHTTQITQGTHLTDHYPTLNGCSSEDEGVVVRCIVCWPDSQTTCT